MKKRIFILSVILFTLHSNSQNECFEPVRRGPFPPGARAFSAADFNSDGILDIYGNLNSGFGLIMFNNSMTFSAATTYTVSLGLICGTHADFNQDGFMDIAGSDGDPGKIYILPGTGNGTFNSPYIFQADTFVRFILTADFNNDGNTDIATANYYNTVSVLLGTGTGSFFPAVNYSLTAMPKDMVAADFNNNGNTDLLVVMNGTRTILDGSGLGTFTLVSTPWVNVHKICTADVNSDSKMDLVYTHSSNFPFPYVDTLSVSMGLGNLTFSSPQNYSLGPATFSVFTVADFDNDGHIDVLAALGNTFGILPGTSSGIFSSPVYLVPTPIQMLLVSVVAADINNDGYIDVFCNQDNPPGIINVFLACNKLAGVGEIDAGNKMISLFPNPAQDVLFMELSTSEKDIDMFTIYNSLGQLVKEGKIPLKEGKAEIDVSEFSEGVYSIKLKAGQDQGYNDVDKVFTKRFVISR